MASAQYVSVQASPLPSLVSSGNISGGCDRHCRCNHLCDEINDSLCRQHEGQGSAPERPTRQLRLLDALMTGPRNIPLADKFWSMVDIRSENECWPWLGGTNGTSGYGRFWDFEEKRVEYTHRMAWKLDRKKKLPKGKAKAILHKCDNPPCCNPKHLRKGTQVANLADMVSKGRHNAARGETKPQAKLTDKQVVKILLSPLNNTDMAAALNGKVNRNTISQIRTGATWTHLRPDIKRRPPRNARVRRRHASQVAQAHRKTG